VPRVGHAGAATSSRAGGELRAPGKGRRVGKRHAPGQERRTRRGGGPRRSKEEEGRGGGRGGRGAHRGGEGSAGGRRFDSRAAAGESGGERGGKNVHAGGGGRGGREAVLGRRPTGGWAPLDDGGDITVCAHRPGERAAPTRWWLGHARGERRLGRGRARGEKPWLAGPRAWLGCKERRGGEEGRKIKKKEEVSFPFQSIF
jgi:hypothetical protein